MPGGNVQSVGFCESHDRLIILFGWAESFCELFRRQITMVVRTGRIINFVKQIGEFRRVPQRQADGQL